MIQKENIEKIAEKTAIFMIENKLLNLDSKESLRKNSGVWYKLCENLLGLYSYNNALHLKSMWERNQWDYKNKVLDLLKKEKRTNSEETHSENQTTIKFDVIEWNQFTKYISGTKRKKFLVGFDRTLAEKLQSKGINCWIICKYNWFGTDKLNGKFWTGLYECYSCRTKFKCSIDSVFSNQDIEIYVTWIGDNSHEKLAKLSKRRIEGPSRLTLAQKIIANGNLNFRASQFLQLQNNDGEYI